ncbi:MAG: hypothetical protein JRJ51_26125 [Deltaproteobacteria bacterium]|nr:hypothetical protein [Deltaproteobacteria bacterium]
MKKYVITGITLLFFCITPFNAFGGDFDGTKDLICACMRVIECSPDGDCSEAMVEDVGIPQFLQINFEKKIIPNGGRTTSLQKSKIWNALTES